MLNYAYISQRINSNFRSRDLTSRRFNENSLITRTQLFSSSGAVRVALLMEKNVSSVTVHTLPPKTTDLELYLSACSIYAAVLPYAVHQEPRNRHKTASLRIYVRAPFVISACSLDVILIKV